MWGIGEDFHSTVIAIFAVLSIVYYITYKIEGFINKKVDYNVENRIKKIMSSKNNTLSFVDFQINLAIKCCQEYIKNEEHKYKEKIFKQKQELENFFDEKTIGFPWAARRYAELKDMEMRAQEGQMRTQARPALKSADIVRVCRQRAREAEARCYSAEGMLAYYESLFPWLVDFRDAPDALIVQKQDEPSTDTETDPAQHYLSEAEWGALSKTERFQRALDRYKARPKSPWEIGREFERFVGYQYECAGWDVTFFGAIKGYEDMGRDLILKKKGAVKIVQCKYWSKNKTIHEKHIFQLFGSCVLYSISNNIINDYALIGKSRIAAGVFITSCTLSDTAKKAAEFLGIEVQEQKQFDCSYPCIKCNIGKKGDRIYHLPFDLNYDKIKIELDKGELYCSTIKEAEAAGFRRAYRWRTSQS